MTCTSRYILTLILALFSLTGFAASVNISVQGSPRVGETFALIIDTRDVNGRPAPVQSVPGCKVLYPLQMRSESSQVVSRNGVTTSSTSASYAVTLRAETEGTYTFGPISVGNTKSNTVRFTIGKAGAAQAPAASQGGAPTLTSSDNGKLFLRATVSNSSPYEQQGVEYVVRLYTSYTSIFDWTAAASPKFGNCTYEASDAVSRSLSLADYNGRAYESAVIARYIIYPTQPGVAKILGNAYTGSVAERFTYHDPTFGVMSRVQPKQIDAKPNDLELNVRPLPPHDGVLSGVGDFTVKAELVTKKWKSHEVSTVRYIISGTGNMGYLSLPDLQEAYPADLKFLKSEDSMNKKVGASSVSGSVTYDCTIIPQREGSYEIPPVKFLFFNPEKGAYYTVEAQGFTVNVEPGTAKSAGENLRVFNDEFQPAGTQYKSYRLLISSPWIWAWILVPIAGLIVVLFLNRRRMARLADVVGQRRRKAGKLARRRLSKAHECMRKNDSSRFYEEMLKALWGYFSDKLNIPTSELTRENISDKLLSVGISDATVAKTISLLDQCEFAKYGSASGISMPDTYDAGVELINNIEDESLIKK